MGISIRGINKGLSTGLKDSGMLKFFGDMGMSSSEINSSLRRANSLIGKDIKDRHAAGAKLAGELQSFVNGDMTHYDRFRGVFRGTRMEDRINSFAPSAGTQFLNNVSNSYTGSFDKATERSIRRHANKLDNKREPGENYEQAKRNHEWDKRIEASRQQKQHEIIEQARKHAGEETQNDAEYVAQTKQAAQEKAQETQKSIQNTRRFIREQNKTAKAEQAAKQEAQEKNKLPDAAREYNQERRQRRLEELRGKYRNMQGQMDTSVSDEQAARASRKSMERHGVDPSSVKVESSAQQSATAKNDKPPASGENPTASSAPQSGGADTKTQSGGESTEGQSGGDSLLANMQARAAKANSSADKYMFGTRLSNKIQEFEADMAGVKDGNFKEVADKYGLSGTKEGKLRRQFEKQINAEAAQGHTAMDWVYGNDVPQKAIGGAAIAGAMSAIFGGGQKSNSDLYSNPFQ